ncbi:MAG: DMT family transporter [Deltaproteobacteria bacterium]|nr:DMT family transporter [Deltaproteobacteria bacterium]
MLVSTVFFALMNVGAKLLVRIPVHQIAIFRALVTIAVAYALIRRERLSPWGHNKRFLILRGVAGTVSLLLYLWTVQVIPLSSAVTIQYLSPIFTVLITGLLTGERARPRQWLLFGVAFAGVLLVKGFDPRVTTWELAVGVVSAVGSGLAYSAIRRLKDDDHPLVVVFYFPLVTIPLVAAPVAATWVTPTPGELALLLLVGLTTTAAQICMTRAYQLERADRVSIINYVGTSYAIAIGYLMFDEPLTALGGAGLVLIIVGVVLGTRASRPADLDRTAPGIPAP